ncbi:UvrD-helicase domain-containing protein [Bacillus sp. Marseille-P3661]|uniref:UvrD-helicase domain-containing protein n=1 Tax=Bacillus sp. Marseille-P3661 TaxID=1936234 RepID=UPI000C84B1A5|nr:UvrD-helicase domain-containing protein [Bacillus sp. Marseille-P3661]
MKNTNEWSPTNLGETTELTYDKTQTSELFQQCPFGATINRIEDAQLAEFETSEQLVADHENDAFYFRSLEKAGIKLNKPQLNAVRHYTGPALVLAGAGSGKTRVLTSRAGYLLAVHKVNPKNILLVTFSKKAADEMKTRMATLPGLSPHMIRGVTTGTFHSIFLRLLKSQGYTQRIITNEKLKQTTIKIIMKEMGLAEAYEPETLLAILSSYKNNMIKVENISPKTPLEKEMKDILTRYEGWKRDKHYLDFDDILLESYSLLQGNELIVQSLQNRFRFILCDEWQDTNPVQFELIKMIARSNQNLFVVGDDDQTIYSFNGAVIANILDFKKEFPNTKTFTLDINYRSTASIVGLANKVISFNESRHSKILKATNTSAYQPNFIRASTTDEEAKIIVENIVKDVKSGKRKFKDIAILHRTASNSRAIYEQLIIQNIPFISFSSGNSFYEQSLVKTVIDYLRIALNPHDMDAIEGILPTLYLNRDQTIEYIQLQQLVHPKTQLLQHVLELPYLKPFQKKQITERLALIGKLQRMKPITAIKEIRSFYDKYLETDERKNVTLHKEIMKETLSEIESSAKQFYTISEYVHFIDKIIGKNKQMEMLRNDPYADCISLMTIHKSKGLEFPVVYLIGASDSILPHSSSLEANDRKDIIINATINNDKIAAAIEEERRLAYVAITRAEEELYISSPSYYQGKSIDVSRFILDPYKPVEKAAITKTITPKQVAVPKEKKLQKEIALVWDCTNDDCLAWIRIVSYEDANLEERDCPICKSKMNKGSKEVTLNK